MRTKALLPLLVSLSCAGPTCAAPAQDGADCAALGVEADLSNLSAAVVIAAKAHFVADRSKIAQCPAADAACKRPSFVLGRNVVVVDGPASPAGFVCAAFIDSRGNETDGWLNAAAIKPLTPKPNWLGAWKRDTTADIKITRKTETKADVDGTAIWRGQGDVVHDGGIGAVIDSTALAQNFGLAMGQDQIPFEKAGQDDCTVRMRLLGPYLYVLDNNNCGGFNVSFTGLYTRR